MKALRWITSLALIPSIGVPVFAATQKKLREAEREMTSTCKKEFPEDLKGKNFKAINDWVEKVEHGDKGEDFKKSKCYDAHEKWEKVAAKEE